MKYLFNISLLAAVALLCVSCGETSAQIESPKSYDNAGLQFEYPGNWEVAEDVQQEHSRYLFVESPGDAILIIQVFSADDATDIKDYAKNFAQSAKNATPSLDFADSAFSSVDESGGYEILTEKFSVENLGVKIAHFRKYRRKVVSNRVCFIIEQVAEEDRDKVTKGFELIVSSFNYSIP